MEISRREYDSIIRLMENDELTVYIDTARFRRLFSKVNGRSLSEKIEESVVTQVAIIKSLPLIEFICLVLSSVFLGLAVKWYAIIGVPLLFVSCFLYYFTARIAFGLIERSHCFFNMFYLEPENTITPLIWTVPPHHESNT